MSRKIFLKMILGFLFIINATISTSQSTILKKGQPVLFDGFLDDTKKAVETYVSTILSREHEPTMADNERLTGASGKEREWLMQDLYCLNKGWGTVTYFPQALNPKCLEWQKERDNNPTKTPSLYLVWIRTLLPLSPKVEILSATRYYEKNKAPYERIKVKLNDIEVTFEREDPDHLIDIKGDRVEVELHSLGIETIDDKVNSIINTIEKKQRNKTPPE